MMALLPNIRRISKEDLPGSPAWAATLLSGMNTFFDAVYAALNGTLTFVENVQAQIKTIPFSTLSTYNAGDFTPIVFARALKTRAKGLWILSATDDTDQEPIKTAVVASAWQEVNGNIEVQYVSGLANSKKYTVTFIVI